MRVSAGFKKVWIEPKIGRFIIEDEYKEFVKKTQGAKFKYLREQLDTIYPDRFTRKKVIDKIGISNTGLTNIEEEKQNKIRNDNITLLCRAYNVTEKLITDTQYQNSREGFLLALWEDSDEFFKSYEKQFLFRHTLDPNGGIVGFSLEDSENDSDEDDDSIDVGGYDVIDHGDGNYSLDRVTLEVSLKLNQTSTNNPVDSNFLKISAVVSVQDADHIKSLIHREIKLLEERHRNYINLKNDHDEFKTLTQAEVAINWLDNPNDKEDAIKALYDVQRKLRNLKEVNKT